MFLFCLLFKDLQVNVKSYVVARDGILVRGPGKPIMDINYLLCWFLLYLYLVSLLFPWRRPGHRLRIKWWRRADTLNTLNTLNSSTPPRQTERGNRELSLRPASVARSVATAADNHVHGVKVRFLCPPGTATGWSGLLVEFSLVKSRVEMSLSLGLSFSLSQREEREESDEVPGAGDSSVRVLARSHLLQDNLGQDTRQQVLLLVRVNLPGHQTSLVYPIWVVGWSIEKWRLEKTWLRWSSSFISRRKLWRSDNFLLTPNSASNVEDRARYEVLSRGSSEKHNWSIKVPSNNYEIPLRLTVSHHRIRLAPGRLRMSSVIREMERISFSIRSDLCHPGNIIHWSNVRCFHSLQWHGLVSFSQNIFQRFKFHNWSWKFQFLKMRMGVRSGGCREFSLERGPPWSDLLLINYI